jgi:hypothetical protein
MTIKKTLAAARNVPWAPTINLRYDGDPLPDIDHVAIQVRQYAGAPGDPLIDLTAVAFADEAATDEEAARTGRARVLRLSPEVAVDDWPDPAITGLNQPEPGEADRFFYDVVITYADSQAERPIAGPFLLEPGVTASD